MPDPGKFKKLDKELYLANEDIYEMLREFLVKNSEVMIFNILELFS